MNPFATAPTTGSYPTSYFARSALPTPQAPQAGAAPAGMSSTQRRNIALFTALFIVGAYALFHWHFNLD